MQDDTANRTKNSALNRKRQTLADADSKKATAEGHTTTERNTPTIWRHRRRSRNRRYFLGTDLANPQGAKKAGDAGELPVSCHSLFLQAREDLPDALQTRLKGLAYVPARRTFALHRDGALREPPARRRERGGIN